MVWSWGPAFLYGCQTRPVCARISTHPTGCGSFQSSIGLEGLSTHHLGSPIGIFFFLSLVSHYHFSLHIVWGSRSQKQIVKVYLNSFCKSHPSCLFLHPSLWWNVYIFVYTYVRYMRLHGWWMPYTLQYFMQEQVRTRKEIKQTKS